LLTAGQFRADVSLKAVSRPFRKKWQTFNKFCEVVSTGKLDVVRVKVQEATRLESGESAKRTLLVPAVPPAVAESRPSSSKPGN
jgi:hypothetical protein